MHKIESDTNADGGAPIPASACGGGMAARVAAHDWSRTPLGPMDVWPQSLRTAVGICLNSRFPMFVWWGTHLINIYNDAYIPVLGKRHPHAFGQPAREIWGDVWPVVGPQAEAVMQRGEATWNERVLLVMERQGYAEDTYFTWSYSPIPDDFGGIGGLFCACTEETQQVLAERHRDQLMAELEAERGRLAETFAQSPAFVAVLRGPEHVFEYANEKYLQLIGRRDVRGKSVEAALPEVKAQGFIDLLDRVYATGQPHVGAIVPVRLRRAGDGPLEERLVDFVFQPMRDADAGGAMSGVLVHGVDVTDRERSAEAVRQSEQRYRTLFSSIDEGFCLCEMIVDKAGRALDYRFLEVNPAFEALTGLRSAAGHTARELVPGLEEHWVQTYARAGMGGESIRFEQGSAAMNRWFTVYASPVEPKGCGKFTLVFSNITERKRAENELQESERRLQRQVAEFETLLNVIPVGIAVALDRDCRSIRTNIAFAAVLGLAVGQNASKTAPADERPTNFRCLSDDGVEILDAQLPMQVAAREGQAVHGVEFNIAHNDGRVVRLLEYAAPLFDEKGAPRGSVGAFVDITDQAATAERLRRSEEQFRVIANSIPQLAWMARPDGWIFWYRR